jgi:hypothetical protein
MAWKTTDSSLLKSLKCACERKILSTAKSETYMKGRNIYEEKGRT